VKVLDPVVAVGWPVIDVVATQVSMDYFRVNPGRPDRDVGGGPLSDCVGATGQRLRIRSHCF